MGAFSGSGLSLGTLWINVAAKVDEATAALKKFGDDTSKIIDEQKKQFESLGNVGASLSKVGGALTAGITLPLAGIAAASISTASTFDSSMNKIEAVTDATAAEMALMRDQALQLGKDTVFSAQQAADGMAVLGAAGFDTTKIIAAMPGVLDLAAAGELSIARAAEVTTDTLNEFGLSAGQAGHVADIMAKGAAASSISVDQMALSMKYAGAIAHDAGMSLEETAAAVALLGNAGIKGEQAGTSLRGIISSLIAPSKQAADAIADLGIKTTDASGKMLPLENIFAQLRKAGATTADMFKIFGENAATAGSVLKNSGPAWDNMTAQMLAADGAAKKMADTLLKGTKGSLEQLKGSVETAAIALGEQLKPAFDALLNVGTKVVNWLIDAIKWFGSLSGPVQGAVFALVAFAAAIGPIILGLGTVLTVIATIGPALAGLVGALGLSTGAMFGWAAAIGVVVAALVALGVYIYQNWDSITIAFVGKLVQMEKAVKNFYETVGIGGTLLKNVNQNLADWNAEINTSIQRQADAKQKAADLTKQQEKLNQQIKDGKEQAAAAATGITKLTSGLGKHATAAAKSGKATDNLATSHKAATKAAAEHLKAITRVTDASETYASMAQKLTSLHKAYIDRQAEVALGLDKTTQNTKALLTPLDDLADKFTGVADGAKASQQQIDAAGAAIAKITTGANQATAPVYGLQDALHQFGIKSTADYDALAAEARKAYDAVMGDPNSTDFERDNMMLKMLIAQRDQMRANSEEIPASMQKTIDDLNNTVSGSNGLGKTKGFFEDFGNQVSTIFTNFAQDISKTLWEGGDSWGEKGKKLLTQLGEAVTSMFLEPAAKAIATFISGALADLMSGKGFGGVLDAVKDLGRAIEDVFTKASKSVPVPGAPGSTPAPGGGAGGVAGAASGGIFGAITAISGAVSAISSVIGNFQMAGMNKSLDVIVNHTLRIFNELEQFRKDAWDRWGGWLDRTSDIWRDIQTTMDKCSASASYLEAIRPQIDNTVGLLNRILDHDIGQADVYGSQMDKMLSLFDRMVHGLESVALGQQQMNVTLTGSDPATVAAKLGTQLRLQGGRA